MLIFFGFEIKMVYWLLNSPAMDRSPYRQFNYVIAIAVVMFGLSSRAVAQPNPNSPTTQWVPILYGNNIIPDPSGDQQTGNSELDIVGNLSEPSLYMQYTNGYLGFRLRLGADENPPGFKGCAFVGLDVNGNGPLDLFIGVDNQGSHDAIGIWSPGSGANTSPSTTSVGTMVNSYPETSLSYNFAPLSATLAPTSSNYDLNADGYTDQYLTFYVPFTDVVSALAAQNIDFTTSSLMNLVVMTATQPNSINGDINGVNGGVGSSQTWTQLGAASLTYTPTGTVPINPISVPEPPEHTLFCLLGGVALLQLVVRRRL